MPPENRKQNRIARLSLPVIAFVGLLLIFISGGGVLAAAHMEEDDRFCTSCHTQPESTFFERTQAATAVDLASAHHAKQTRCIDCHSGSGISGRANAMMIGSVDLIAFVTGTASQPAPLTHPISDDNCLKCHSDVAKNGGFNNHFHRFLASWQSRDAHAATCVTCHSAHTVDGSSQIAFLQKEHTLQICQDCHNVLGKE